VLFGGEMRFFKGFYLLFIVFLISCDNNNTAQIWTDRPEFAVYAEYFNAAQNQYKVAIKYHAFPAEELVKSANTPDIVAASWLRNAAMTANFRNLNNLFGSKKLSRNGFYLNILDAGMTDRKQYLLPVSFNLPALIFSKDRGQDMSNPFTINFNEIKELSGNYNVINRGIYTRMGFSPLWHDNFIYLTAVLFGSSFRESNPLEWDSEALEKAMDFINNWTNEINTNIQAEEEFTFKYFFEPPEKLIKSERIHFSYMKSSDLFTLSDDSKNQLDFRWIMEQNMVPVAEDTVFLGIHRRAKSQKAARAFIIWFFQPENQQLFMEYSRANRINESIFGICGGFSALTSVTEQVFPLFYPEILGRMPLPEYFTPSNVLPGNWLSIKERVVLPYLHDRARIERKEDTVSLETRLSDWIRMNR
jgi:ABC-type glycerol-3-phosphate transport system substrate-binding protein